jgi:predicted dehydrogenase
MLRGQPARAWQANDEVSLGFVSCGGRATELMNAFQRVAGVNVAGLCDPDEGRVRSAQQKFPRAKTYSDLRDLYEDREIDAVVVATCNHWHCLAAIWAMQAGKHVYVEKPLSHSQWEGKQTVAAAEKYGRVCQIGTQQRSDPMQAEIKKFLYDENALGEILSARVNRYGVRASIGKRDTPLPIPAELDMNLWLGPAQEKPIYREQLHYDWHWDWNTGSGEMGNWGVHVLDDLRNIVFRDQIKLPRRIAGGGGRVVWNDAGETPNVHFVFFDTGTIPVVIGLANITAGPDQRNSPAHPGPGSGYIAYCEGGRLEGQRGAAVAFDRDGNEIKRFKGNSGNLLHQANFIEAVRAQDPTMLNAPVQVGHDTTGWCNLANITYQVGTEYSAAEAHEVAQDDAASELWATMLEQTDQTLQAHGLKLDDAQIKMSPLLEVNVAEETFAGTNSAAANALLKRDYRAPFVVPEIV